MSKEKLISLTKYADDLKSKLQAGPTKKHVNHPASYKLFLERELDSVSKKIETLKMEGAK